MAKRMAKGFIVAFVAVCVCVCFECVIRVVMLAIVEDTRRLLPAAPALGWGLTLSEQTPSQLHAIRLDANGLPNRGIPQRNRHDPGTEAYELYGEVPGIERKDVHIELTEPNVLLIRGHIDRPYKTKKQDKQDKYGECECPDDKKCEPCKKSGGECHKKAADSKPGMAPTVRYLQRELFVGDFARDFAFPGPLQEFEIKVVAPPHRDRSRGRPKESLGIAGKIVKSHLPPVRFPCANPARPAARVNNVEAIKTFKSPENAFTVVFSILTISSLLSRPRNKGSSSRDSDSQREGAGDGEVEEAGDSEVEGAGAGDGEGMFGKGKAYKGHLVAADLKTPTAHTNAGMWKCK
ncbi:hypothetical protein B0T26DRAFT_677667 [Lasiosphaeria miniovina]|uniref:Uncharacterized protein n=1 Tax=Lasiosphaeria miniovina TaxID=1954250 RepID=A0AA40ACL8_9PEZI|nr:uncharacterized protein B0T26DRAFT_677667 [Lasiosphaeria miniovina]KAK0713320.1 hypothetical protein B0T26DRAFT_677667 [Lasiosphaeria miniovina]